MAEQTTIGTDNTDNTGKRDNPNYKLIIDDLVVEKIAAYAAQRIDGIIEMKGNLLSTVQETFGGQDRTKGVSADVHDDKKASIELSIILEYGKSATDVFNNIKRVINKAVKDMTGLDIDEMTVHVVDVITTEEYKAKQQQQPTPIGQD